MRDSFDFLGSRRDGGSYYPTTLNKNAALHTNPHYTDHRFDGEQTVFGKVTDNPYGHPGLEYVYSDRVWEWDYQKAEAASKLATAMGHVLRSCNWYEAYLSAYFGKTVEVRHIVAGVNKGNGYPYAVFGYVATGEPLLPELQISTEAK